MQNPAEPDFRSEPIVQKPWKSASIVLSFDLPRAGRGDEEAGGDISVGSMVAKIPSVDASYRNRRQFSGEAGQFATIPLPDYQYVASLLIF